MFNFRLTAEERDLVERASASDGMTASDWARRELVVAAAGAALTDAPAGVRSDDVARSLIDAVVAWRTQAMDDDSDAVLDRMWHLASAYAKMTTSTRDTP